MLLKYNRFFACKRLSFHLWSKSLELVNIVFLWALSKQLSCILFILFFLITSCFLVASWLSVILSGCLVLHGVKRNKNKLRLFPICPPRNQQGSKLSRLVKFILDSMASISAGSFSSCQIQQYVRNTSWKIQQKLEEKIRIWKYNKKYECGAKVTILCIVLQISPPYFWLVSFIFVKAYIVALKRN